MKFQYVTSGFPTKRGDPPSENKLASKPGKVEANQKQIWKFEKPNYKPRPRLLQVGGAR